MFLLYMAVSLVLTAFAVALAVSSLAKAEDMTVRELLSEFFEDEDVTEYALGLALVVLIVLVAGCFLGPLALSFSIVYAISVWVIKRINK